MHTEKRKVRKRSERKIGGRAGLVCALSGALGAVCFYLPWAAFLMWILPVPALVLIFREGEKRDGGAWRRTVKLAAAFALTFFFCSYLVGLTIDVGFSRPVMFLLDIALISVASIVQGLPQTLALCLASRLRLPWLARAIGIALMWTAAEWLTTVGVFAFPVRLLAVSQWRFPLFIRTSAVFGELFVSFVMILFASLIAMGLKDGKVWQIRFSVATREEKLRHSEAAPPKASRQKLSRVALMPLLACAIFLANIIVGAVATHSFANASGLDIVRTESPSAFQVSYDASDKNKPKRTMRIAAVQHNQPIDDADILRFDNAYEQSINILDSSNSGRIDLLILPESTAQFVRTNEVMQSKLEALAHTRGADILVGGANSVTPETDSEKRTNSQSSAEGTGIRNLGEKRKKGILLENAVHLFTKDDDMSDYYYAKQQLVPFFENGNIQKFSLLSGDERGIFNTTKGNVGAIVCFESVLQETVRDTVGKGAELITVPSNDAYLGEEIRRMHISHSVFRAIETNRAIVQVATNGVTAAAYPDGRLVSLPMNAEDTLIADVPLSDTLTPYVRFGNLWLLVSILVFVLYAFLRKHVRI